MTKCCSDFVKNVSKGVIQKVHSLRRGGGGGEGALKSEQKQKGGGGVP